MSAIILIENNKYRTIIDEFSISDHLVAVTLIIRIGIVSYLFHFNFIPRGKQLEKIFDKVWKSPEKVPQSQKFEKFPEKILKKCKILEKSQNLKRIPKSRKKSQSPKKSLKSFDKIF